MSDIKRESLAIFMRRCIDLARIAQARGDSPVGSVLVRHGEIIAEGIEGGKTHRDITYHAEVEAIRHAVKTLDQTRFSDCILITTHEPCILCSYVIRHHGIKHVVWGVSSGAIGGYSSAYPILTDTTVPTWPPPPQITKDVLHEECKKLKG